MIALPRLALTGLALALAACTATPAPIAGAPPPAASATAEARAPVTILVSIDGFRADYLDRGITPRLSALAAGGVRAAMRPSFPSKTFPNHEALVTGLRPDRSGIVANRMTDPRRPGEVFTMATLDPFWWDEAEPIWVTAEQAGIRTATMFWPGSNAKIEGVYPSDWQQFNQEVTSRQRVDAVIDWLRRPAATRPRFITLYFDTIDTAGHHFGPDSPEVNAALTELDGQIGRLVDGLKALGQPANLVIVADHGMAATSTDQQIRLDTLADPADFTVFEEGPYASIDAVPGHEAKLARALVGKHPHSECWRKADIPARFHYGHNPRIPAFFCLAETGWTFASNAPDKPWHGGNHGWDNDAPEMRALFIANGPAFARGATLPTFDNVDVAPLLRELIGLPAATGLDGTAAPFAKVVKPAE